MKEKKSDNRGFTLVELLIAITILTIIVGPLLLSFVSVTKSNVKTEKMMNKTTMVQNILEGVKSIPDEDALMQVNYPAKGFSITENTFGSVYELIKNADNTYTKVKRYEETAGVAADVTSSILSTDAGTTHEFINENADHYYFCMEGLTLSNLTCDALVHMDASAYKASGGLNTTSITEIVGMNSDQDAFYAMETDKTKLAINYFENMYPLKTITENNLSRKITVTAKKVTSFGDSYVTVSVDTEYVFTDTSDGTTATMTETYTIFNNKVTKEELRSVYLFYAPLYSSTSATSPKDQIIISNNDEQEFTLYIIKQETGERAQLSASEAAYKMGLTISEDSNGANPVSASMKLKTNLNWNLYAAYDTSGTDYTLSQVSYNYNTNTSTSAVETLLNKQGIMETDPANNIYDVTVTLYEAGTAAAAGTDGFPSDKEIYQSSGSAIR